MATWTIVKMNIQESGRMVLTEKTMIAPQKSNRIANQLNKMSVFFIGKCVQTCAPLISHCQKQCAIFKVDVILVLSQESWSLAVGSNSWKSYVAMMRLS